MPENSRGHLFIDQDKGQVEFKDAHDRVILRVTHLPTPIPPNVMIDLVAIRNVTSYTKLLRIISTFLSRNERTNTVYLG
jgi:hypothetical protein